MIEFFTGAVVVLVIVYLLFGFVSWFISDNRGLRQFFLWWEEWL